MLHTMPTATSHRQPLPHNTPVSSLLVFQSHWHTTKGSSPLLKRLAMRSLEVIALAAAMLVIPFTIHSGMLCFDAFHEFLGRRARSPYSATSWGSVVGAVVMMAGWTLGLGRLGYLVDGGAMVGTKVQRHISWGRILGRIVIPLLLVALTGNLALEFWRRVAKPMPFVTANIVGRPDVEGGMASGFH